MMCHILTPKFKYERKERQIYNILLVERTIDALVTITDSYKYTRYLL